MATNHPHDPRAEMTGEPPLVEDALGRLEERLDRASEAAERLLADAAGRVIRKPPPAGWQQAPPPAGEPPTGANPLRGGDAEVLLSAVLDLLRDRLPPDLQQRLNDALREVLLALRALIDWYLERVEATGRGPAQVEDIPIL